jgi:hypothetical protein
VPGIELRRDTADRRGLALNAILGAGVESINAMAEVLLLPSLILAFFVAELTPSYVTIGLVPAVASSLWTLARVPAFLITTGRRRQKPWAFAAALIRAGAIAVLAIVASRTDPVGLARSGRPLLVTFFLCLIVFTLAGGFGSVPTAALLRSSIAADGWQRFVRQRSFSSSLLSLIAVLVVARLLGSAALTFPGNYGRVFLVTTVCLVAAAVFVAATREGATGRTSFAMSLASPRLLRQPLYNRRFQRFLLFRTILSATAAIDPFLFLYAVTRLGAATTTIGTYAVVGVLGWVVSAPLWMWLEQRSGSRALLQSASVLRLVAPAAALVLPQLAAVASAREPTRAGSLPVTVFAVAFFAIGAAMAAQARGNSSYLTALAPRQILPAYSALTNGVLAIVAFSPVVGGIIIEQSSYEVLFGVSIAVGLIAVFAGGWLADTPATLRDRAQAERGVASSPPMLSSGRA